MKRQSTAWETEAIPAEPPRMLNSHCLAFSEPPTFHFVHQNKELTQRQCCLKTEDRLKQHGGFHDSFSLNKWLAWRHIGRRKYSQTMKPYSEQHEENIHIVKREEQTHQNHYYRTAEYVNGVQLLEHAWSLPSPSALCRLPPWVHEGCSVCRPACTLSPPSLQASFYHACRRMKDRRVKRHGFSVSHSQQVFQRIHCA
jgi:hypothetical protein